MTWEAAKDEWGEALKNTSPAIIKEVLVDLRNSPSPFPPNLPEFMNLCKIAREKWERANSIKSLEPKGNYVPASEKLKKNIEDVITKCGASGSVDLMNILKRCQKNIEEKGVWKED